jgi:outer membrane protein OmpA-like peptidoglycan-associated protein
MIDWNPYFYFSGGLMSYDLITNPSNNVGGKSIKDAGWCGIFPVGIGTEYALSENILLDCFINSGISTTWDLDGYDSGDNQIWDSYFNIGIGLTLVSKSCREDKDIDQLGQCDEEILGTDPLNPDTDNDGLKDGDEVLTYKTDPLRLDTDADSLTEYDELITCFTNPLVYDTDKDKLSDGEEVLSIKTDPLKTDCDSDDLIDGDEVLTYKTNPLRADTDGDGLSDGGEVLNYTTDPNKVDTDGDGLSDSDEIIKYKTNPNKIDTDSGTIDDFTEVRRGSDPLNAEDDIVEEEPIKINIPIVLEGITFAKNKADITPESEVVLQGALNTMQIYPDIIVEIGGHTDSDGSAELNQILSQKRAESVRLWLINNSIAPERIIAKGYGEDYPRAPNDSSANKKMNRRIEFKRIK